MSIIPNFNASKLSPLGFKGNKTNSFKRIPMPDFSDTGMVTKSSPKMSDEKFKDAIISLAKKDASEGKFGGEKNPRYMALKSSFVSVVSPDRSGIISRGLDDLYSTGPKPIRFAEFKDSFGNVIAHYSPNGGWRAIGTPSEIKRESEFDAIYNATWREAYHNSNNIPTKPLDVQA